MVLKRIFSCFAIIGVVFFMSCYDVQLDKQASTDEIWYEGLSSQQIMEGMEIKGSMSDVTTTVSKSDEEVTEVEKEVEVTWEWPVEKDEPDWEVSYKLDDDASTEAVIYGPGQIYSGTETSKCGVPGTLPTGISEVKVSWSQTGSCVFMSICFKIKWCSLQTLLTVQVKMKDSNGSYYWNTVTFLVAPCSMTCTIRPGVSEALVPSTLYRAQLCILQGLDFLINPNHDSYLYKTGNAFTIPENGTDWNLEPFRTVFFGINSDFSNYGGFGDVKHHSSSSYCKVTRETTPAAGAVATFKYSFEDLPKTQLKYEDDKFFDYDDVVFYVDLKNK